METLQALKYSYTYILGMDTFRKSGHIFITTCNIFILSRASKEHPYNISSVIHKKKF